MAQDRTSPASSDDPAVLRRRVAQLEEELLLVERSYRRAVELTQQVGQALRQSEERYRAVVESAGETIAVVDQSGTFLFMNSTGAKRVGRTAEQVVGRTMWDLFPKEAADSQVKIVREVVQSGQAQFVEAWTPAQRGTRFFRTSIQPLKNEAGPATAAMVIARDSTDQKLAEEESRKTDQWLQLILRHSQDGIVVTERDMKTRKRRLILCNDRYIQMAGRSREELMAADDLDVFVRIYPRPDGNAENWEKVSRGEAIRGRASWIRPDGRENVYEWMAAPLRVGDKLYLLGIDRDVTEEMRAEAALRDSEQRFRELFENAPLCVFECDGPPEGRKILRANLAAQRRFGYSEAEFASMPIARIVPDGARGDIAAVFESLSQGQSVSVETPHLCRDGSVFPSRLTATILPGALPNRTIGMVEDITELKQAEQALLASERAEHGLRMRLKAMNEVANEISLAPSFDELCRRAVALGLERLGFERLGLWFWQDGRFFGSFGTDEQGCLRDERGSRGPERLDVDCEDLAARRERFIIRHDQPLRDDTGALVGKGTQIVSALWDGQKVIGFLSADNLLHGRQYTEADGEVLTLYAAAVGRLCSRQRAEDALRASEIRYRAVVEDQTELVARATADGTTLFVNQAWCDYFGIPRDRIAGKNLSQFVMEEDLATIGAKMTALTPDQPAAAFENRVNALGQIRWLQWTARGIFDASGHIKEYQTSGRDITDRKLAEQAVQALHAQLMNAREEERKRLAEDLHDSVGQRMIAMSLAIQDVIDSTPRPPASMTALSRLCKDIVGEIRDACHGLYPPTLESLGLAASLRQIAADFRPKMKMRVTIAPALARKRLAGEIEIALFRIAQEALSNAVRHSGGTQATLDFARAGGLLKLVIQDNGRGFDTVTRAPGLGLDTMRERAKAVGGKLEVTSRPGRTRVVVTLPEPAEGALPKTD